MAKVHALKNIRSDSKNRSDELRAIYYFMVENIVQGKYEATATTLNELRAFTTSTNNDNEAIRRFVAVRLAIKKGDPGENTSWIDIPVPANSWLSAEQSLVHGHWEYHLQHYSAGITHFQDAENQFRALGMLDREFVSAFNAIIGEVSGPIQLPPLHQLERLRTLETRVRPHVHISGCARVQAMIHRQKSHAFEDLARLHASLEEVSKAISIFETHGPASDYHLALLHAADVCLDIEDNFRAKAFFEYVIPPVDARIEFPLAYVKWRLGGPVPDKDSFSVLPGGWKEKFEQLMNAQGSAQSHGLDNWQWDLKTGRLRSLETAQQIEIKPSSLEGRLIRLLSQAKASKSMLIETLWPSQSETQLLDNRLHRMISRLNKKLGNLIEFDGKCYRLKAAIGIE